LVKRGDFIIHSHIGQAFAMKSLLIILRSLVEQGDHICVIAVEQHAGAFHAQIGNQDSGQNRIEDR